MNSGTDKLVDDVAMSGSATRCGPVAEPAALRDADVHRHRAHLRNAAGDASDRVERAGGESQRLARDAAVRFGARGIAESRRAHRLAAGRTSRTTRSLTKGGNYDSKRSGEKLVPGKFYDLTFDLQPDDEFVPAGKRLAVMIMSSDREFTLWPKPGTELTVDLAHSSFSIPIVGGTTALEKAGMR